MTRGRKQLVPAAIALALVAALTIFAQSSHGQRVLRELGIVARSHGIAELSFIDPASLPDRLSESPQEISLPFMIGNHGSGAQSYRWEIASGHLILRAGEIEVPANQAVTLQPRFKLGCSARTRIDVSLSTGQRIGLWLDCSRPAAAPRATLPARPKRAGRAHRTTAAAPNR